MELTNIKIKRSYIKDVVLLTYRWRSIEFGSSYKVVDPNTISLDIKGTDEEVAAMEKEIRKNGYIQEEMKGLNN
jgi:hypothetical protein